MQGIIGMNIKVVSFDLGHTLAFPRYDWMVKITGEAGIETDRRGLEMTEMKLRRWFDELVLTEGVSDELWKKYYTQFFSVLGAPAGEIENLLLAVWHEHSKSVGLWTEPAPGAEEVLSILSDSEIQLACVSNNDGRLPAMIDYLGWSDYFDLLVDSGELGISKPDPGIFEYTLKQLDRQAAELIHIGDYYSVDVIGARRAGATGILYDPLGGYGSLDCTVISDLKEVCDLLESNQ